jgi:hypothetical protein
VAQALRSFPQYLTLTSQDAKIGSSIYNALEVVLTKRIGAGFTLGGNYSWSKALGYGESGLYGGGSTNNVLQNAYNPHAEWSLLPIDVRNSVTLHYIYDLPFGRGRAWLIKGGSWIPYSVDGGSAPFKNTKAAFLLSSIPPTPCHLQFDSPAECRARYEFIQPHPGQELSSQFQPYDQSGCI